MILAGTARTSQDVKELGDRLGKLETEMASVKAEKTTHRTWTAGTWTVLSSLAALVLSA